jgi:glutamate carboxypeptidase
MNQDLMTSLSDQMPEALGWLRRMVEINSFTTNAAGVNSVGLVTAECFAELGFTAEAVPSSNAEHGAHLFLQRKAREGKPVLLVTHLDTVFPPDEERRNNFHWQESPGEGRIYGPGTVDIKGGTILIWMMLRALREFEPAMFERTNFIVAANASEEVLSDDFYHRTAERCPAGARAVLVFEGGPRENSHYHIVTSRKGRAEYVIRAHGNGAHAGSSHAEGLNAIVALAGAVQSAAAVTNYEDHLTVNVARIEGGTVLNRVPHEAHAELEMRAFDPVILQRGQRSIEALATGDSIISVECLGTTPAWAAGKETEKLLSNWHTAAQQLGVKVKAVQRGGLSDANYLCTLGPALDGLGPAGGNAHCSERSADGTKLPEFVETNSFVPKAALNVMAIAEMLNGREQGAWSRGVME